MAADDNPGLPSGDDILREHLGYAVDLMAMALREIAEPPHDDNLREWYRQMSIIEVFWSQARILVEFFTGVLASTTTTAANRFTEGEVSYQFPKAEELRIMRNNQIAHMNYARTTNPDFKLGPTDMYLTAGAIDRALKRFEENLRPDKRKIWDDRIAGHQKIQANLIYASRIPSACTAAPIQVQTTTLVGRPATEER